MNERRLALLFRHQAKKPPVKGGFWLCDFTHAEKRGGTEANTRALAGPGAYEECLPLVNEMMGLLALLWCEQRMKKRNAPIQGESPGHL